MSGSENEGDQTIVINDLLSFIWCKMKLCTKERLLKCVEEFYSEDAASEALKTLLTALPSKVSTLQNSWKETNSFVAIMNALEIPSKDQLPIFVCKNLNNVPKLKIIKKEPSEVAIENKKEFYRDHQRIKMQLNDVYDSLFQLKRKFLAISESKTNRPENHRSKSHNTNNSQKDLAYLQSLIDGEKRNKKREMLEENSLSESEDDSIREQRINLIAIRKQRAALRRHTNGKSKIRKPVAHEKIIHIANDGKTSVADASDSSAAIHNDQDFSNSVPFKEKPQNVVRKDGCRYLIVNHLFHEVLGNLTLYKCSSCSFCSNDERTAMKHVCIKQVSFKKTDTTRNSESTSDLLKGTAVEKSSKQYECYSCSSSFKTRRELQDHVETHMGGGHRCPLCTSRFSIEEWLEHVRGCPGNGSTSLEDHYCEICDTFYADKRILNFHKAFHDPSRPFECSDCKFRFYTRKAAEYHFRGHKLERERHKCPFCDFRAVKGGKIIGHIRCHTGDRPYKCPKCERFWPTYDAFQVHFTTHSETKAFGCGVCGKTFKSQSKAATHRKIHDSERPYKCPICGKGFKFGRKMALHHKRHLDIRKHACPQCPYKARTVALLQKHMDTHSNVKPFKCPHCDFGANHINYLNWHIKFDHKEAKAIKVEVN